MTNKLTMEVNGLQLRRTDEGWQYLSEGYATDPDTWCDATSTLGPFSGDGVNHLLDELASAKAREEELTDTLEHIRGKSSCSDAWDLIDEVLPNAGT